MESLTIENFLKAKNEKGEASREVCAALEALCSAATKIAKLVAGNGIGTDNLGSLTETRLLDGSSRLPRQVTDLRQAFVVLPYRADSHSSCRFR